MIKESMSATDICNCEMQAAAEQVSQSLSGIDLLINNAGIEEGVDPIWETWVTALLLDMHFCTSTRLVLVPA